MYAVASRTYAFYSFNMIMYGAILSLGAAATVYDAPIKLSETDYHTEMLSLQSNRVMYGRMGLALPSLQGFFSDSLFKIFF